MIPLLERAIGLYHFLGDRAPRGAPLVDPRPRPVNPWRKGEKVLVSRVTAGADIRASVEKSIGLLGGLEPAIERGDRVLVKPNFNSPDPAPAATDPEFLRAVVEILMDAGARVTIGECSGGFWRPTSNVLRKLGIIELARDLGVELVAFEDSKQGWVRVKIGGDYLDTVTVPRLAYEADKIVYLPCLKTHSHARFTGALKLAVGLMHPGERRSLHASSLEPKVAEINLCLQPNLIIMDGRKAFVTGGPDQGELVEPGLVMASGDPVALDVEAMKVLLSYGAKNKMEADPWQSAQIVTALRHGLGAREGEYLIVE